MKIRFLADANFNEIILLATIRREPLIDFQTASAGNLANRSDSEVLSIATQGGRILVTHDQKTMPRHFSEFIPIQTSAGVLIIPQHLSVSSVVDDLLLIWTTTEADEWVNRICFLPL